ncbi:MAG: hypothetical protein M3O15_15330, partial [Acidobacteriota bacterium]|nr:hypothetical protein [Acidobacteriota bacterium]
MSRTGIESPRQAPAKTAAAAASEPSPPSPPLPPSSPSPAAPEAPRRRFPADIDWSWLRRLAPLFTVLFFAGALWLLHHELAAFRYRDVFPYLGSLPRGRILFALLATTLGYAAMTGYDTLAFRTIRVPLPYRKIALASFSGYAFSNSLGHPLFTSTPIRARLYAGWGLSALQVTQVVLFCFLTFWLGFLTLSGSVFLLEPLPLPAGWQLHVATTRPLGLVFLAVIGGYLWLAARRKEPVAFRGVELPLPGLGLAVGQVTLSCLDWGLAGVVLYALLPPAPGLSLLAFLALFLLAQLAGVLSQVPGGLGVFESAILLLLTSHDPTLAPPAILGALVAFRGIYYFTPLLAASLALAAHEVVLRHKQVLRMARGVGTRASAVVPQVLSLTTFLGGALLLVSGAT